MKIIKKIKSIFLMLFILFVLGEFLALTIYPSSVFAQKSLELTYPGKNAPKTVATTLSDYVTYIFNFLIRIAGLIVFGSLIYGGIRYLTSTGSPSAIADAKDQILSAFLGLIILLSSYLILHTLNPQLVKFTLIPTEKVEIPKEEPPPPEEEKEKEFVFFQVPTGKIIERAVLDEQAKTAFNLAIKVTKDIEEKAEKLKELTRELKEETDKCKCGNSDCEGCSNINKNCCYGSLPECTVSPYCFKSCPEARCDMSAIQQKVKEIKSAIEDLKTAQEGLAVPNKFITKNLKEIERAGVLMSLLAEEIEDYNTMLIDRYLLEKDEYKVKFDKFPGWEDIQIRKNSHLLNDPATFYFLKENNEEVIAVAEQLAPISAPSQELLTTLNIELPSIPELIEVPEGVLNVHFYSQRDPRWANIPLGATGETIGSAGCYLTSIASALTYLGFNWTPPDVLNYANSLNLINKEGCITNSEKLIKSLAEELGFFYSRVFGDQSKIGQAPLVTYCSNYRNGGWGHFILVKGIKENKIYVNDPYWHDTELSLNQYIQYNCGNRYDIFEK